jgi:hypothetical protein
MGEIYEDETGYIKGEIHKRKIVRTGTFRLMNV